MKIKKLLVASCMMCIASSSTFSMDSNMDSNSDDDALGESHIYTVDEINNLNDAFQDSNLEDRKIITTDKNMSNIDNNFDLSDNEEEKGESYVSSKVKNMFQNVKKTKKKLEREDEKQKQIEAEKRNQIEKEKEPSKIEAEKRNQIEKEKEPSKIEAEKRTRIENEEKQKQIEAEKRNQIEKEEKQKQIEAEKRNQIEKEEKQKARKKKNQNKIKDIEKKTNFEEDKEKEQLTKQDMDKITKKRKDLMKKIVNNCDINIKRKYLQKWKDNTDAILEEAKYSINEKNFVQIYNNKLQLKKLINDTLKLIQSPKKTKNDNNSKEISSSNSTIEIGEMNKNIVTHLKTIDKLITDYLTDTLELDKEQNMKDYYSKYRDYWNNYFKYFKDMDNEGASYYYDIMYSNYLSVFAVENITKTLATMKEEYKIYYEQQNEDIPQLMADLFNYEETGEKALDKTELKKAYIKAENTFLNEEDIEDLFGENMYNIEPDIIALNTESTLYDQLAEFNNQFNEENIISWCKEIYDILDNKKTLSSIKKELKNLNDTKSQLLRNAQKRFAVNYLKNTNNKFNAFANFMNNAGFVRNTKKFTQVGVEVTKLFNDDKEEKKYNSKSRKRNVQQSETISIKKEKLKQDEENSSNNNNSSDEED